MNRLAYILAVALVAAVACVVMIVGCDVVDTDWLDHVMDAGLLVDEADSTIQIVVGGEHASYTIRLGSSIDADVTIHVASADPDSGVVASPGLYVFKTDGADSLVVTVQAAPNAEIPDFLEYRLIDIHHWTESADPNYDELEMVYSVKLVRVLSDL